MEKEGRNSGGGGAGEGALQYAGGDVEHVGNGVLETAEDEEHDGKEDGGDFTLNRVGAKGHPDSDAD